LGLCVGELGIGHDYSWAKGCVGWRYRLGGFLLLTA
jgi:hypothetical protein